MAKARSAAATEAPKDEEMTDTSVDTSEPKIRVPDASDYDDVSRPDIDGWAKPAPGLEIHGRIVGFFAFQMPVKDKEAPGGFKIQTREALCIKVYQPVRAFKKGDEVGFDLGIGQVIALSMSYALDPIRPYIDGRGQVYIKYLRKDNIGSGHTAWKAKIGCKGVKGAPAKAIPVQVEATSTRDTGMPDDDDDGVPF